MTRKRLDKKTLCFILLAVLIIAICISGTQIYCSDITVNAAGTIQVDITLEPSYQLVYKGGNYLVDINENFYTDNELFAILNISETVSGNPVLDLTNTDVAVTSHIQLKDVGTYSVTFVIDNVNTDYFGTATLEIDISPAVLNVSIDPNSEIFYGQTVDHIVINCDGFVGGETAEALIGANALTLPDIINVLGLELIPANSGVIELILDTNGKADNYTVVSSIESQMLIVNKARAQISFSLDALPYVYNNYLNGVNPSEELFNLMEFVNTDINESISTNIEASDIIISNPESLLSAGNYEITLSISNDNEYYTLASPQVFNFEITKAELIIADSAADNYFDIIAEKSYDETTDFPYIDILSSQIIGINGEIINITGVEAVFASSNAGIAEYTITYTINSNNYEIHPIVMSGIYAGLIHKMVITMPDIEDFIGFNISKQYDSTRDVLLYDKIYFLRERVITVFSIMSAALYYDFNMIENDIIPFAMIDRSQGSSDEYTVLRLSYYEIQGYFFEYYLDAIAARNATNQFIVALENLFIANNYDYDVYTGDSIANLYFTPHNKVVQLSGATNLVGEYADKNAGDNKNYTIYFNNLEHDNYTFGPTYVQGGNGSISPAYVGIINPTIYKYYGQSNPSSYDMYFIEGSSLNELNNLLSESITVNNNEISLPYPVFYEKDNQNHYIYRFINSFYSDDILNDPEISSIFDTNRIIMNFLLNNPYEEAINVYRSIEEMANGPTRYELAYSSSLNNYMFVDVLMAYGSNSHYNKPALVIKPKEISINDLTINTQKDYNANSKIELNTTSYTGFLPGEENLFDVQIIGNFKNAVGENVTNVSDNLIISDLEYYFIPIGEITDELILLSYNYTVDKQSFALQVSFDNTVYLELLIINNFEEEEWIDYTEYINSYNGQRILNVRLSDIDPFNSIIKINKAQVNISIIPDQRLRYGNDILEGLEFIFNNFYEDNPKDIFFFDFEFNDYNGIPISHHNDNSLPTGLLPSLFAYRISIIGYIIDSEWLSIYGGNYNINIDYSQTDVYVDKGYLTSVAIADKQKTFGESDPQFGFDEITNYRDSDYDYLISLLTRTSSNENITSFSNQIFIELLENDRYDFDYTYYSSGIFTINSLYLDITPAPIEIPYGTAYNYNFNFNAGVIPIDTEIFGAIDVSVIYHCFVSNYNVTEDYIYRINQITVDQNSIYYGNVFFNLLEGLNKIKIVPLDIEINLTAFSGALQKNYDGTPLVVNVKNPLFNYSVHLYDPSNPNEPIPYEDRTSDASFMILNNLQYNENLFFLKVESGMIDGDLYEKSKAGQKDLFINYITIVKTQGSVPTSVASSANYNFIIADQGQPIYGNINKRVVTLNPSPSGQTYSRPYNGEVFRVDFAPNMANNLLSGHTIDASTIWFETADANVNAYPKTLFLRSDNLIVTDGVNDLTENYALFYNNTGSASITARNVALSLDATNQIIPVIYNGGRIAISLEYNEISQKYLGTLYSFKNDIYTTINDEFGQPLTTIIVHSNIVLNHYLSGKIITLNTNAGQVQSMVRNSDFQIVNSIETNYTFTINIRINITSRNLEIDVNHDELLQPKEYDGNPYSIALNNLMANNLAPGQALSGSISSNSSNASSYTVSNSSLNINRDYVILDGEVDVTSNYNITLSQRVVTITPKEIIIDINLDESLSKQKTYNGSVFRITLSNLMVSDLINGESIFGTISTEDANAYTLDEFNNVIYDIDTGEFIKKPVQQRSGDTALRIEKADGSISTGNYSIIWSEDNKVSINPKEVRLDISRGYMALRFIYTGAPIEILITETMIINMYNDDAGLVGSHYIADNTKIFSAQQNVGTGIDLLHSIGDVVIVDSNTTLNYDINYIEHKIEIIKRNITINISKQAGVNLEKVYDGKIYEIVLTSAMDDDIADPTRGLVNNHLIIGSASTADENCGNFKALTYEVLIKDADDNDNTNNYNINEFYKFVAITPKEVDISIDAAEHSKIYDGNVIEILLTNEMLSGLLDDDVVDILLTGSNNSFVKTDSSIVNSYELLTNPSNFKITIIRDGTGVNVTANYQFNINIINGELRIEKRQIYVITRNNNYILDGEDYISDFNFVYNEAKFIVDYSYYVVDSSSGKLAFVDGHIFNRGSRITDTFDAADKIFLASNVDARIIDTLNGNTIVTNNYQIEYIDSYVNIHKRKIRFDVALELNGSTDIYDEENSFIKTYNGQFFDIKLEHYMMIISGEYRALVSGHTITDGYLKSENGLVARDNDFNVIPKPLIWDTQRPLRIHSAGIDVTHNYDIDTIDTQQNFVERVITIRPQLLVIDIRRGVQLEYSRPYNGMVFEINVSNTMVVDNIPTTGGLIAGHRIIAGKLVTLDANVSLDAFNNVADKVLFVCPDNKIVIQDLNDLSNNKVADNYDIRIHKNVNSLEVWQNLRQGDTYVDYENYLPTAKITRADLSFSLSKTEKFQKYYDATAFNITVKVDRTQETVVCEGTYINNNPLNLFTVIGLYPGEYAEFTLFTQNGNVSANKVWFNTIDDIVVTKDGLNIKGNYNIQVLTENFAHILPRPIWLDVNLEYPDGLTTVYNGELFTIDITNNMVYPNGMASSMGLLENNNISGKRKSVSANAGIINLTPDLDNPIVITNGEGQVITSQYVIYEASNQRVNILKKELIIDANIDSVTKQKVYDGTPFVINLNGNIVTELVGGHYVAAGFITTTDKNAAIGKDTFCNLNGIVIRQQVDGAEDIVVTNNYNFTYVPLLLDINKKPIQIMAASEYYKPYNENNDVTLSEKNYRFRIGDICDGDIVRLVSYTANFTVSIEIGTAETLEVTNLTIDNPNYQLINQSFYIIGQIVAYQPIVQVQNSVQIKSRDGVIFVYDGTPKTANYTVSGLDGVDVQHTVKYQNDTDTQGNYLSTPPINAGLYKMIIETNDSDYPYWNGAIIMIQINPAEISISFTGSLNQIYGSVTDVTARIVSSGGLNIRITPVCRPIFSGYSYPDAGEYELQINYNTDTDSPSYNPNYYSATRSVILTVRKKNIQISYGQTDNLVYDGLVKSIPVSIVSGLLPSDIGVIGDNNLIKTYSGDYNTVRNAGKYSLNVSINNHNYSVENNTMNFSVQKKEITIKALLNNSARITIYEGDTVTEAIIYEGFVSGENRDSLIKPAYLPHIPRKAINDYAITPFGADSLNYTFKYIPAYVTILERKVAQVVDNKGIAIITGEYGSFTGLHAEVIETNVSNPVFYRINENIQRNFASSDLLDKYRIKMAYNLTLSDADSDVQSSTVRLKLSPELQNEDKFMVLHFNSDGQYEMLGAYKEGEYIVFNARDMGDFIILTPRGGLPMSTTLLLFLSPIALFIIGILFYMLFRRKYDVD